LSKYDLSAFIQKIVEIKSAELKALGFTDVERKIKITYVGHSMGGMTLPIYVIHKNMNN
jgi:triacylglycerol esterase/lipase EstA (alpha/beta hydrolase family)